MKPSHVMPVAMALAFLVSLLTFWFLLWQWAGSPLPIQDEADSIISQERN